MRTLSISIVLLFTLLSAVSFGQSADTDTTKERRLSIDVKDHDIRDVIRMISKGYDLNIVLDRDVTGKVTLHLSDVPILEGLQSIAESNGLQVIKEGSVYKIQKATAKQSSKIRFVDGKLTVDVQNVDVKDFLKELSSKTAVSIVPDANVEGQLSGKLYQVPLDDGLRALLEGNGFKVMRRRNIYQVQSSTESSNASTGRRNIRSSSSNSANFYVDYSNGVVSIDVINGDLEDIINAIADQSDVEIVTYGNVKTEVNAKLHDAPLTEALALLLGGTRFTFVQKGDVILIGDRNTATPSGQALSKSELIHLKHIKADNVPSILPKDIPPTNVRVIKEQNALLVSGTSEDIVTAREFLETIDIPTPQVRIDAIIVEYKDNIDKVFGVRYGARDDLVDKAYMTTPGPETEISKESDYFEFGASGKMLKTISKELFGKNGIGVINNLDDNFFLVLRFLETQNKAKVLAQPSILTLNGNKASIDVSETQYFKITTGIAENYTVRYQPIKFGIQLDITPWISQSGQITAEISPVVSNGEKGSGETPNVSSRSINTTVRLNDGETLVLGGLIKNQESEVYSKIPFLGNLPIIGALFRRNEKRRSKSNLVVYITPHIVKRDESVDLDKELKKLELRNKHFLERKAYQVYQGTKKIIIESKEEKKEQSDISNTSDDPKNEPPKTTDQPKQIDVSNPETSSESEDINDDMRSTESDKKESDSKSKKNDKE